MDDSNIPPKPASEQSSVSQPKSERRLSKNPNLASLQDMKNLPPIPEPLNLPIRSDDEPDFESGSESGSLHSQRRTMRKSKQVIIEEFEEMGMKNRYLEMEKLFVNNIAWSEQKIKSDPDYFLRLKDIQTPDYLWIGCADSRVPANEILGLEPGEIFVHRNIANLVMLNDLSCVSVVEFAVNFLKVKHIIVCGHFGCSGIKYAYHSTDAGLLNPWITSIKENYRHNRKEIDAEATEEERIKRFVEYNVIEGCMTLMKMHSIQKSFAQNKYPVVHACVYDLSNGKLINLNIDFIERMKGYGGLYNYGYGAKH